MQLPRGLSRPTSDLGRFRARREWLLVIPIVQELLRTKTYGMPGVLSSASLGLVGPVRKHKRNSKRYEPGNNLNRLVGVGAHWCVANLGLLQLLGLRSGWDRRIIAGDYYRPGAFGAAVTQSLWTH